MQTSLSWPSSGCSLSRLLRLPLISGSRLLATNYDNHLLQVARIRYEQSSALLAEEQKELSEQEEQQMEALQQKRLADLVLRQCTTVLKSVLAHKVRPPFTLVAHRLTLSSEHSAVE